MGARLVIQNFRTEVNFDLNKLQFPPAHLRHSLVQQLEMHHVYQNLQSKI